MRQLVGLLFLFFFYGTSLFSQEDNEEYTSMWHTADNALPQNSIKSIVKDNHGFIWISTENGIVRYDGKDYLVFDTKQLPELTSNRMFFFQGSVLKDSIYISNDYQQHILIHKGKPIAVKEGELPSYIGIPIFRSKTTFKKIYYSKGYYEINEEEVICRNFKDKAVWKVALETSKYTFFIFEDKLYACGEAGAISSFSQGKIEKIIIKGLNISENMIYANQISQQVFFRDDKTLQMLVSKNNQLCVEPILKEFDFHKSNLSSIFFDKSTGILYLGSKSKGLLSIQKKDFKIVLNDTSNNDVYYAQLPFGDNGFISSYGELFTPSGVSKKVDFQPADYGTNRLMFDKNGNLWFKSFDTLYCYLKSSNYIKFKSWYFKNYNIEFLEDTRGKVLIGLSHENNKKGHLLELTTIEDGEFNSIMSLPFLPEFLSEKEPGVIWTGTDTGLYKIDVRKKKYEKVKAFHNFKIRSLKVADKNKIWVTTYGNGFFLYDDAALKTIQFPLDKNNHLAISHCIVEDSQGFFWISTNNGLFQVSKRSLLNYAEGKSENIYYHFYDKSSGFATNEFNGGCKPCGILLNNNSISFPSMQGYVVFDPSKIKPILPNGKIFFEEAEIDNVIYQQKSDTLYLDPDFGRVRLFIRSPYFGNPNNLTIEVKVDGPISQNWSQLHENNITFTSLPPGTYTITARKLSGFDSKYTYATKTLIIPKKFWQTTFFKLLLSCLAIFIGYFIVRWRINYLQERNLFLEKKVSKRTEELNKTIVKLRNTKNRLRLEIENHKKLIGSITHDIKTPLRFLSLTGKYVYQNIQDDARINEDKEFEEAVKSIYTSSSQLYNFVDNLLEYTKIGDQESESEPYVLCDLIEEKIKMFSNIAESKKVEIRNRVSENLVVYANRLLLSIIIHNLLDNAVKNTIEGQIYFISDVNPEKVILKIIDTGKGMSIDAVQFYSDLLSKKIQKPKMIKIGMGLQMISELVKLLEGEIEIKSQLGIGTEVDIQFKNRMPTFDKR